MSPFHLILYSSASLELFINSLQANMLHFQLAGASCGLFYSEFYLPGLELMECTNTGLLHTGKTSLLII